MKVFNAFFSIYRTIFYLLVIAYLIVSLLPMAAGIRPYVVLSGSMEPVIHTGSLAYIQKADSNALFSKLFDYTEPTEGDIIAFTQGSGDEEITVVHRIRQINDNGTYTMKGDNNENDDIATISKSQIIGNYMFTIPYLGYAAAWIQSKKGLIIIGMLALVAFVSSFIGDANENIQKNQEKKEISQQ